MPSTAAWPPGTSFASQGHRSPPCLHTIYARPTWTVQLIAEHVARIRLGGAAYAVALMSRHASGRREWTSRMGGRVDTRTRQSADLRAVGRASGPVPG